MDGVVAFDYTAWSLRYPELAASVTAPLANIYFAEAQLYCDNTPSSPVTDWAPGGQRAMFLNMITAHIAALNKPGASALVGRISNATEGSVSVQTQLDGEQLHGRAFWAQTRYGLAFWQASAQYRTMRYIASPARPFDPFARRR